jgi:thiamine-phosphate pyrophosphorylase
MLPSAGLPPLYPILDAGLIARAGLSIESFAHALRAAGIRFLQYRDKDASDADFVERALLLREIFPAADSCLILNDRVSLWTASGFEGIHVGQQDSPPLLVRQMVGEKALVGLSTHNEAQLRAASESPVDYLAIGPVFPTSSKLNPDPVIGIEGIRSARSLTTKPLIGIGGITSANCTEVVAAGADSVAVISDLLPRPGLSTGALVSSFVTALAQVRRHARPEHV